MSVTREPFGRMPDGRLVEKLTMTGEGGLAVSMVTYGAAVSNILFDGRDICLGFDSMEGYLHTDYIGATIGRYGNRIAGGRFSIDGVPYQVGCNEGGVNHLHGGMKGFNFELWEANQTGDAAVTFHHTDPDGHNGFPGTLDVYVTYAVLADNTLEITYHAVSDKDTILNMTNHTYFNLNGYDNGDIKNTVLTLCADAFTPAGAGLITTGEIRPVEGTPFDFRQPKAIGKDWDSDYPDLHRVGGYDHNFVLGLDYQMRHVANAYSPKTGIQMDVYSDQPGVQLYTGHCTNSDNYGKGGVHVYPCQGFCLETQDFPDAPNKPCFPSCVLRAGDAYDTVTRYSFSKK